MNEPNKLRQLSGFEWFGLLSGIVGLIADTYALSSIFAGTQNIPLSSSQLTDRAPVHIWIIIFCSIVYTILILSFYVRRVFCIRHRREKGNLSSAGVDRIEKGVFALTCILSITLILSFCVLGSLAFEDAVARDIAASGKAITSQSQRTFFGVTSGVIMGLIMSFLAIPIHFGAKALYAAFDPEYGEYTSTL